MGLARRSFVGLLVIGGVLLACAERLSELDSYPCALDGTCPLGFTCIAAVGCKEGAPRDATCSRTQKCAVGDCVGGLCLPHCAAGAAVCEAGRVCSYPASAESSPLAYCLVDCANTPCPSGLECRTLFDATKGCVSPASTAALDKPCKELEDCFASGISFLPITCAQGTCAAFCATPAVACGDSLRTCVVGDAPTKSGCLLDCGAGQACPDGLRCEGSPSTPTVRTCIASGG